MQVINRKHNRTINQDIARKDGRWVELENGQLQLRGSHNKIQRNVAKKGDTWLGNNKWISVKKDSHSQEV